jgi:hypothetical protein
LAVDWVLVLEKRFVEALALFLGVPPTEQFRVSQSSPPKKTFTASSGVLRYAQQWLVVWQ